MPRILHIEASSGEATRIERLLCDRFQCLVYRGLGYTQNLADELSKEDWDAFLVEEDIPYGALKDIVVRIRARSPGAPVLLLCSRLAEGKASELAALGISDFVFKASPTHLGLSLERTLGGAPVGTALQGIQLDGAVLDCVGVAIYLIRADTSEILYTNPRIDALFGYAPGELLGRHVSVLNAPVGEGERACHELVISSLRKNKEWSGEILCRRKDGSLFWCFMSASVLEHPQYGTLWLGARQDISARKEAEAALQESKARFGAVFQQAAVGIARVGLDGRWLEVNDKLCAIVGYGREELLGMGFPDITYGPDLEADLELANRLLAGHIQNYALEKRYVCKDGGLVWIDLTASLVRKASGEPDYFIAVMVKIQRRKEAEAALEAARQTHLQRLEQQVAERTAALQEAHDHLEERVAERTEQVRRLAAELTFAEERERQALARDLHDNLGQLLHVVKIRLGLLGKQDLPAQGHLLAEEASTLISDASRLVRSLTSQLNPPVLSTLGLPAALKWLSSEVQQTYGLRVSCRADVPQCSLAPAQAAILFRAARELLINTTKHSGSNSAVLELDRDDTFLTMTVADSGRGIPMLDKVLAETPGFGLASVRERIAFLGGTTRIEVPPGGGLRIELQLPLETGARQVEVLQ